MQSLDKSQRKPARTPKQRENQIIDLVMDKVEQQIAAGRASSQILCHFLKLATEKERLENERLRGELELAKAKVRQIDMQEDLKNLYEEAISAMKGYRPVSNDYEDEMYE